MRQFLRWTSLFVLFILFSCTKGEEFSDASFLKKPGVYGFFPTIVIDDEPATKATFNPDPNDFKYVFEVGDKINIWSNSESLLIYKVISVSDNGRAEFYGGGFTLTDGETYYSSHPLIKNVSDDPTSLSTSYEGQTQIADGDAKHLADYAYTYSSATCTNGHTSFQYSYVNSFIIFNITLPDALTLTELSITEINSDNFFAVNGSTDVTTGIFTPGESSNNMTLKLGGSDGITVEDGILNAYLAIAPCDAGDYVIRLKGTGNKVYTSPVISKTAIEAGKAKLFNIEVFEGENPGVAKIGDVMYETLADAVAAVQDGETIEMIADVADAAGMKVASGKNFTVDFGGHTYTLNKPGAGSSGTETNGFQLLLNSTITFKNGTINISEENLTPATAPAKNIMRIIQNYANLTLDNMTIDGTNQFDGQDYVMSFNNGTSELKDTQVITGSDNIAFDVCTWDGYTTTTLDITGESNVQGNVEISASNTPDALALTISSGVISGGLIMEAGAEMATIIKANEVELDAPAGYKWADNDNDTKILVPREYVAQIGETKYETFAEAAEAAQEGDIIDLLDNAGTYTMTEGQTLKVRKNGKTITVAAPVFFVVKSSTTDGVTTYTLADADIELTRTNGAVSYITFSRTLSYSGTYKLLKDISATGYINPGASASDATIDLNGHTLTSTATDEAILLSRPGSAAENLHKKFKLIDSSTEGGGKLVVNPNANHAILLNNSGSSKATYTDVIIGQGVTIEGGCVSMLSDNSTLVVEGTINGGNNFAIATNGNTVNTNITIKDGAVLTSNGVAMYLPGSGTTTIEDGAVITGSTAIYVKSGILNIEGGEITGNGEKKDYEYWDNGCHSTGDALVVDNCGYPGGAPAVNVTGGTFTSTNAEAIASYSYGDNDPIAHFVHGGYFSTELDSNICEEGKICVLASDKPGYYELSAN